MPYIIRCKQGIYAGYTSLAGEIFILFANRRRVVRKWKTLKNAKINLEIANRIAGNKYKFEIIEVEDETNDGNV